MAEAHEQSADELAPKTAKLAATLDDAERCLRDGHWESARRQVEALRPELAACGRPELEQRARLIGARALESSGRLGEAVAELADLLADFSTDSVLSIGATTSLSHWYLLSGDLNRAVETGERQLDRLRGLDLEGCEEAIRLAVTVAAAHFERGDVAHAVRMCRRAVEQAERLGSPRAIGSAYWNASLMEAERGAVEAAVPLAIRALELLGSAGNPRERAQLRSELGRLLLLLDPPRVDEARAHLETAQAEYRDTNASPIDLAWNALHRARVELLSGDPPRAEELVSAVLEQHQEPAPLLRVGALILAGEVAATRADAEVAAERYRQAVLELSGIGSDRRAAEAWFELGALLDDLGLEQEAHDAYRSAAASAGLVSAYQSGPGRGRRD